MSFDIQPVERKNTGVMVAIFGPSKSGKTLSALRIACGLEPDREKRGVIDSEHYRASHYGEIGFMHLDLTPPYGSLRYLEALQAMKERGVTTVVVDSLSHEHEGVGGMLEQHADLVAKRGQKYSMPAWAQVKPPRRKLISWMMRSGMNIILCFRAKDKIKPPARGEKEVQDLGSMAIGGEEFIYECLCSFLLEPGAKGVPTLNPEKPGAKLMATSVSYLSHLIAPGEQLSEVTGKRLAEWANAGSSTAPAETESTEDRLIAAFAAFDVTEEQLVAFIGKPLAERDAADRQSLKAAHKTLSSGEGVPWSMIAGTAATTDEPA